MWGMPKCPECSHFPRHPWKGRAGTQPWGTALPAAPHLRHCLPWGLCPDPGLGTSGPWSSAPLWSQWMAGLKNADLPENAALRQAVSACEAILLYPPCHKCCKSPHAAPAMLVERFILSPGVLQPPTPPFLTHSPMNPTLSQTTPKVDRHGKRDLGALDFPPEWAKSCSCTHGTQDTHPLSRVTQALGQGLS